MKAIWYLFVLIMGVGILVRFILENNHSKLKKDIFSDSEAGDTIIERNNGMKEEHVIYSEAWGKKNPDYVIINNEKISVGDKVWREEIGNMEVFIIEDCGNTIKLILKLEDNAIPSEIGRKFVHPLHTNWFKGNVPGLYHEIRVPYTDKKLENLVIGRFYKISQGGETMREIKEGDVGSIKIEGKTGKGYEVLKETTDRPYLFNCKLVDEKEKQFTKSDLKAGDMVELRNGEIYIFMKDAKRNQYDNPTDIFMGVNSYRCIPFSHYNDNLLNSKEGKSYDIMKMSDGFYIPNIHLAYPLDTFKTPDWVWEREETEEMTLEEVCQELGRDIKIVKEH